MEKSPHDKILSYAQKNNGDGIHEIIKSGCPVLHSNRVGQTALHISALWGNSVALSALLAHIPRFSEGLNTKNKIGGSTPLHAAANSGKKIEGRRECVKLLIEHGADPKVIDAYDASPASYCSDTEMRITLGGSKLEFHQLFKDLKEENVESRGEVQERFAGLCIEVGGDKVKKSLMGEDENGRTGWHCSVFYATNAKTARAGLEAVGNAVGWEGANGTDNDGRHVGHLIVQMFGRKSGEGEGEVEEDDVVKAMENLVSKGKLNLSIRDFGDGDGMGGPPSVEDNVMMKATEIGDYGVVRCLAGYTEPEEEGEGYGREENGMGEGPFDVALRRGRLDLCRLLRSGVDLDKPTPSGSTGLTDACRRGRVEVVKYLVSEGADCNREGRQGFTPTLMACRGGKLEVVRILVEEGGGAFQARKAGGKNGIEWAESQGDRGKEVVEYLKGRITDVKQ